MPNVVSSEPLGPLIWRLAFASVEPDAPTAWMPIAAPPVCVAEAEALSVSVAWFEPAATVAPAVVTPAGSDVALSVMAP